MNNLFLKIVWTWKRSIDGFYFVYRVSDSLKIRHSFQVNIVFCFVICIHVDFFLVFLGWLGVVKSIHQPYLACKTLHNIHIDRRRLDIICNSSAIVYINQLTLNDLGRDSDNYADNNRECLKTSTSSCFRSIPSEIPWNNTFFRKISEICNGNHNCTLQYNELEFYAIKFRAPNICSNMNNLFQTRVGCIYECFPCKYFVFAVYNTVAYIYHILVFFDWLSYQAIRFFFNCIKR